LHTKSSISAQRGASRFSVLSLLVFAVGLSACGVDDSATVQQQDAECPEGCVIIGSSRDGLKCFAGDPGCCEVGDPTCSEGGGEEQPSNNVSVSIINGTAEVQNFAPTGSVNTNDYASTTLSYWKPGTISVAPGQTAVFPGILLAPYGTRLSVDSWMWTTDPTHRSGQGYSITMLTATKSCVIRTTGLAAPNGVSVTCT
jgi:hypothetical protein